jgi:nucleosome assembly protein 1-like 1
MGRKKTPSKGAAKDDDDDDDEEEGEVEVVTAGVSKVKVGDNNTPAPFSFNAGSQGQGQGQFSFNFPTSNTNALVPAQGKDGDDEEEEEEIDMVEEFLKSLPESQQECVKALEELDVEVEKHQTEFRKEFRALQRKYEELESSIFSKRAAIISGEQKPEDAKAADGTGIPDFWLGAMRNASCISENITEKDEVILKSLKDITARTLPEEEGIGFRLEFTFAENEFFTNTKLTKTYFMADGDDDPVLEKAEGTPIDWAAGKNVTVKIKKKKQRNKNGKGTRTVTKTEPCESFFNFFNPPKIPGPEDLDMPDEELEHRQQELEADYDMGISLREKVIPHAVKWFTGEAEDDDDDYDDEDDGEEYDGEELEEGDEDEEEDEPPQRYSNLNFPQCGCLSCS